MRFVKDSRIAITGTGICTAIGDSPKAVLDSLMLGKSGIKEFLGDGTEKMHSQVAAVHDRFELHQKFPKELRSRWDRATQMSAMAATDAVANSGLSKSKISRHRIGLAVGVSGAAQFSPNRDLDYCIDCMTPEVAELLLRRNVPHFQLYQLANWLDVTGPQTCLCSASAGSGIAIGNAIRWLLSNQADAVIAGGGEAIMLLNFLGFDTLGLLSKNMCSPFSGCDGMNMGEGAAFIVLERFEDAVQRKADIRGLLLGFGVTSDAFDPIQFDPSGDGILRAMDSAIKDADIEVSDIEWIRASGAGGLEQDSSEVMAIRSLFGDSIPLVTSTEANFGHCNGAGPAIGIVAAVEAQRAGFIPPTLNYETQTFEGIDFVPNISRKYTANAFLSTTAAFGGTNVVLVGSPNASVCTPRPLDDVVITGMGVVSGLGCFDSTFSQNLRGLETLIGPIDREDTALDGYHRAGLVRNFSFRNEAPSVPARGLDLTTQYAIAAAIKAKAEAEKNGQRVNPARFGVATGIVNTSGTALEKLLKEVKGPWATPKVGRTLLNKGRFLVTSRLAKLLNCKGYNATHSGGAGCGQMALNQAFEQLRQSSDTDAIVVVATDEITKLQLKLTQMLGWLADDSGSMNLYSQESTGSLLGEGAVALVLERRSSMEQRGGTALAEILSVSNNLDSHTGLSNLEKMVSQKHLSIAANGNDFEACIRSALERSQIHFETIEMVLGAGCGIPQFDLRELSVVDRLFSKTTPFGSSAGLTGVMYSSSSLINLCLSVAAMNDSNFVTYLNDHVFLEGHGTLHKQPDTAALIATSEDGHNVATILRRTH